jgi:hypothetical protein
MPLSRPIAISPLTTPSGIRFTLADRGKMLHCIVTHGALEKLAQKRLAVADFAGVFETHRDRIEAAASDKYDASRAIVTPFTIMPDDLRENRVAQRATAAS